MMTETPVQQTGGGGGGGGNPHVQNQGKPTTSSLGWIQLNMEYFVTIPGIIKGIQLLIGIICMACASPAYITGTHLFLFIVVTSFIITLLWVFLYFFGIREVLNLPINWILTELLHTGITTILYVIVSIIQLVAWSKYSDHWPRPSNLAGGVFGLFNTIAYGAGTYFLYLQHKSAPTATT